MTAAGLDPAGSLLVADVGDARLAFTGRAHGNVSLAVGSGDVDGNRRRLAALVGCAVEDMVFMAQVHGGKVGRVGTADRGRGTRDHATAVPGVDALVTTESGVALVVMAADCVPVLLVEPGRAIAAVHAGRRGIASGIVPAAVAALSGHAPRVVAFVGPAVGGCCYEVPPALAAMMPEARASTSWGTDSLDLPSAVAAQLRAAGVERIERVGSCTRCDAETWFSHRAAGEAAGAAPATRDVASAPADGRQAAVVVLAGSDHHASLDLEP